MLKLICYPPAFGEPSASPFSVKAMCLLEMSGQEWKKSGTGDPRKAPKAKLPLLIHGDKTIADSDQIRDFLETHAKIDFDAGLSTEQRGISRVVIRMVEEHLYFALICDRWGNDENWEYLRKAFFSDIPKIINGFITRKIRKQAIGQTYGQGMGRHSDAERFDRAKKDVDAIVAILSGNKFLFGDNPTAADASVVPMLNAIAAMPAPTDLSKYINDSTKLLAYMKRGREAIYPKNP